MRNISLAALAAWVIVAGGSLNAQTIPLIVDSYWPDDREATPVKFGVPFPKGHLIDAARVKLVDGQGRTLPHQQRVLATWDSQGREGVRWLLVDMLADPSGTYALVVDDQPQPAQAQAPVARLEGDIITLDTGPLTGTVATHGGLDLFSKLKCVGTPVVTAAPGTFSGFYVEHETRGLFRADLDPEAKIVLEESGPIRATIKADGWYVNDQGERFCRYSIRAHFFRGRSDVRLDHTFIFTGLSKDDRLRSVSLALPRTPGKTGYLGGADFHKGQIVASVGDAASFVQDSFDHEHIELTSSTFQPGKTVRVADRAGGWITYDQATVAIRDAWQQYPWELEVDAGVVRVHLWPRHGRLLDTTWDGQWWFLSDRQKQAMAMTKHKARGTPQEWTDRLRAATNATGAAKTHELWVSFNSEQWRAFPTMRHSSAAGLAREVAYPLLVAADPQWTTSTRALDFSPHAPPDPRWRELDDYLDAMLDMVNRVTEERAVYGWWDWGGYHQHALDTRLYMDAGRIDNGGQQTWHRAHPKSHYSWGILPWNQVYRTASRDWLRYAQTYTLYSADRAHVHHTAHGRDAGAEYHYDNSEIHWMGGYASSPGGDILASPLQYKGDYLAMYWLTGDRRPLDVLESWGDLVLRKTDAGDPWGTWNVPFKEGNDIRNAGMQLHRLMTLYQATWDERYRTLAQRMVASFLGVQTREDLIAQEMYMGSRVHGHIGWAHEGLWLYWNLTGDERIKTPMMTFINRARDFDGGMGMGQGYGVLRALTYGYLLTGDSSYLDLGRGVSDYMLALGAGPSNWGAGTLKFDTVSLPLFIGTMASADDEWKSRRLPLQDRGNTLTYRCYDFTNSPERHGARVYFREQADRAWSVDAVFTHSGRVQMQGPDGRVVAEASIDAALDKRARLSIPTDGQAGDYVLVCVGAQAEPGRRQQPFGRIVRTDLPMVFDGTQANYTQPTGVVRKAYVQQPANQPMTVLVEWRTPQRVLAIRDGAGQVLASTQTTRPHGNGTVLLTAPQSGHARELSIGVSVATPSASEESYPFRLQVAGPPNFLAVNPGEWFEPVINQAWPIPADAR
jgi:hypothetical protein